MSGSGGWGLRGRLMELMGRESCRIAINQGSSEDQAVIEGTLATLATKIKYKFFVMIALQF